MVVFELPTSVKPEGGEDWISTVVPESPFTPSVAGGMAIQASELGFKENEQELM